MLERLHARTMRFNPPMRAYGIYGLINYPVFFFIWYDIDPNPTLSFWVRLVATLLSAGLLCRPYVPKRLKPWFSLYWVITVMYTMPFFSTVMLLENQWSNIWTINAMFMLFLMNLLLDWASFMVVTTLGTLLGVVCMLGLPDHIMMTVHWNHHLVGLAITFAMTVVAGSLLSQQMSRLRAQAEAAKYQTIRNLGASIAHELRSPLAAIHMHIQALMQSFQKPLSDVNSVEICEHLLTETAAAQSVIDSLLANIKQGHINTEQFASIDVLERVSTVIDRYPLRSHEQGVFMWRPEDHQPCILQGDVVLFDQVLVNLISNALYAVQMHKTPRIAIQCMQTKKHCLLSIEDNGSGISQEDMPHIFHSFYSKKHQGTGLGLAFVQQVLEAMGVSIHCHSQEGVGTKFELEWPVVK